MNYLSDEYNRVSTSEKNTSSYIQKVSSPININKTIEKSNNYHIPEKGIPININKTSKTNDLYEEEYSLYSNIFDPSKFSPPSQWKQRLEMRIKSYERLNTLDRQ